jgi:hypothetical protein
MLMQKSNGAIQNKLQEKKKLVKQKKESGNFHH